jgi:hypothetical protein
MSTIRVGFLAGAAALCIGAVVACGSGPNDAPEAAVLGGLNTLARPAQPGEKGCGPKIECDDGNPCTVDSCVRGQGCVHTPSDGAACDDGNACTQTDTCVGGACTGSNPIVCGAEDACHGGGTCDPTTGACSNPSAPDGTACNDGNACTQTDTCQAGSCTGANPVVCAASDPCHAAGSCDPATGACLSPALADGTPCDDGNACTGGDSCQAGACQSGPTPCMAPSLNKCVASGQGYQCVQCLTSTDCPSKIIVTTQYFDASGGPVFSAPTPLIVAGVCTQNVCQ